MEKEKEELVKWLSLTRIHGLGSGRMLKLLGIFRDVHSIFSAPIEGLYKTRILTEAMIEQLEFIKNNPRDVYLEYILDVCERENIEIIPFYSEKYPLKLKTVPDAPLTLYALGDITLLTKKKMAIVGSRQSDIPAKKWAFQRAKELAVSNIVVVSGGAIGIDYSAHEGALEAGGKTISVLASGLLRLYPAEHRELFQKIKKNGLLLSENPPESKVDKISLVRRNRIISGLSSGLVLVTSSTEGGSKTQLKIAHNQRIPIFCPNTALKLLPNEGILEAVKDYGAIEITDIQPLIEEIKKEDRFFTAQKTL